MTEGDVDAVFGRSDIIFQGEYATGLQVKYVTRLRFLLFVGIFRITLRGRIEKSMKRVLDIRTKNKNLSFSLHYSN